MRMLFALACVAALVTAFAQNAPKPENLLVNGGFDQGPDPGGYKLYKKGDKFPGWTVTKGSVDHIGTYFKCAHKWCLDMNGNELGAIRQTISTDAGKKYELSFMLSANPQCGQPKKALRIRMSWDDPEHPDLMAAGIYPITAGGDMKWVKRTMPFTAGVGKTHLQISSMGENSACGPLLDEVSITLMPDEPAAETPKP